MLKVWNIAHGLPYKPAKHEPKDRYTAPERCNSRCSRQSAVYVVDERATKHDQCPKIEQARKAKANVRKPDK